MNSHRDEAIEQWKSYIHSNRFKYDLLAELSYLLKNLDALKQIYNGSKMISTLDKLIDSVK